MDKQDWIKKKAYLRWHNREVKMGIKPYDEEERKILERMDWEMADMDYVISHGGK